MTSYLHTYSVSNQSSGGIKMFSDLMKAFTFEEEEQPPAPTRGEEQNMEVTEAVLRELPTILQSLMKVWGANVSSSNPKDSQPKVNFFPFIM
jgi:hypothetical protein